MLEELTTSEKQKITGSHEYYLLIQSDHKQIPYQVFRNSSRMSILFDGNMQVIDEHILPLNKSRVRVSYILKNLYCTKQ